MWLVFFCAVPQLHKTYELRLRCVGKGCWDCLVFSEGQLASSFSGDGETSANDLWSRVFTAIGVPSGMVSTGD